MAQTSLNRYYTIRKRPAADDQTPAKRRKLTECTRLDMPAETHEHLSTEVIDGTVHSDVKQKTAALPSISKERRRTVKASRRTVATRTTTKAAEPSPEKTQRHLPAYKRFAHLTEPIGPPASSDLPPTSSPPTSTNCHNDNQRQPKRSPPHLTTSTTSLPMELPRKYQLLAERFRCTDTVVNMLQKRRETCTFDKLKQAVQEMTRRNFQEHNLAQIKTVHPHAFTFRQEKNIPGIYDRRKYEQYQLTIECVTEDRSEEGGLSHKYLNPTELVKRRKEFHHNLTQIVRKHHQSFLSSLDPPLSIPEEKVLRWHPAFPLEHIPDVEPATLPRPPVTKTYTTARDVLNVARSNMAPRVRQALAGVAAKSEEEERDGSSTTGGPEPEIDPALRGVPKALLEKIRRKEAAKAEAAITRDPLKEKKLEMVARLPEFCRIMRIFFIAEKKAAIPWDNVVQKLSESNASGLPPARVEEHLSYLQELVPEYVNCVSIRKTKYIKLQKDKIRTVAGKLKQEQLLLSSP